MAELNIQEWFSSLPEGPSPHQKGLASLTLLIVWKIWKERNVKVFLQKLSPTFVVILDKIKCEVDCGLLSEQRGWIIYAMRVGFVLIF
jgi:hypothetical protein